MIHNLGQFLIEFSTKADGNLRYAFGDKDVVEGNRVSFARRVGIDYDDVLWIDPSHSANVCIIDSCEVPLETYSQRATIDCDLFKGYETGFDGMLTFDPSKLIGVLTADCIPLLVWHHETSLHGIVHVGLLGLLNNIVG